MMVWMGQTLNFTPQTQVEVNRLPRTIDVVLELPDAAEQSRLQQQTPFTRLRTHNQIEFKGKGDRLGLPDYYLIRGRCMFYMADKKLWPSQMSLSVVTARRPRALLGHEELTFEALGGGYYLGTQTPPTLIIVINELPPLPKNFPLLLFASTKTKFIEFLRAVVAEPDYHFYLDLAYLVQYELIKEEQIMEEFPFFKGFSQSAYFQEKSIPGILQDIGDRIAPHLTDTMIIRKSPAFQELVTDKAAIQQLPAFQELVADKAAIQQLPAFQELQEQQEQKTEQRTLLRLLHRRFGELPDQLVQRIEGTTDRPRLEQWQENLLEVSDLVEFERRMGTDSRE